MQPFFPDELQHEISYGSTQHPATETITTKPSPDNMLERPSLLPDFPILALFENPSLFQSKPYHQSFGGNIHEIY
jgi:hypothetical protein